MVFFALKNLDNRENFRRRQMSPDEADKQELGESKQWNKTPEKAKETLKEDYLSLKNDFKRKPQVSSEIIGHLRPLYPFHFLLGSSPPAPTYVLGRVSRALWDMHHHKTRPIRRSRRSDAGSAQPAASSQPTQT
jgi:hypothetical protein